MEMTGLQMEEAIVEARLAMGLTHPNPAVGAVIAHRGETVARGRTQAAGQDHAEIVALKHFAKSGLVPDESTVLTVTMEPCSTVGRTGACTQAIIDSGIQTVVIGSVDPNPVHAGRGIELLKEAGLKVIDGVMSEECSELNLIFNWRMEHGEPFFAAKVATTLDGRIATRGGLSKWITGPESRRDVHQLRRYYPAIAVGAGTVLADDPSLSIRIEGSPEECPIRFIFDRHLVTFRGGQHQVYSDNWKDRTIVVTSDQHADKIKRIQKSHSVKFWMLPDGSEDNGLGEFSRRCQDGQIDGVLIEGGAQLLSSFLKQKLIHYLYSYRAPKLLADTTGLAPFTGQEPISMQETIRLEHVKHACFGDDQLMRGFVVYPD